MDNTIEADLCVIGAGSGGLSVAAGASQLGVKVVLVERGKMGGDCLNYGCVPSKALLAAGRAAQAVRASDRYGVNGHEPAINFNKVHSHVQGVINAIAPHDSVERFRRLGVRVIENAARFIGRTEVVAGRTRIRARRFVIATGSRAFIPSIPGLADVPYLTNETIFDLSERPQHLIVVGGGPIGVEMAQAHRRLGARVTLIESSRLLVKDDPDAVDVVRRRLTQEGIDLWEGVTVRGLERAGNGIAVLIDCGRRHKRLVCSHVLVATGRQPSFDGLNLKTAGVRHSPTGIIVDARLRTTNSRIFAIGDVIGGYRFTHMAAYHAEIVIKNALFRVPARVKNDAVPWVTYTDPELAQVGMTESAARQMDSRVRCLTWPFAENDRAQAERETDGFIKIIVSSRGRVLGATIVGVNAGELIFPWVLAVTQKLKIGTLATLIAPYPTFGEASKRVAGSYYLPLLRGERTRRLVRFLSKLGWS